MWRLLSNILNIYFGRHKKYTWLIFFSPNSRSTFWQWIILLLYTICRINQRWLIRLFICYLIIWKCLIILAIMSISTPISWYCYHMIIILALVLNQYQYQYRYLIVIPSDVYFVTYSIPPNATEFNNWIPLESTTWIDPLVITTL